MIDKARENYPDYKFELADALNDGAFDPDCSLII